MAKQQLSAEEAITEAKRYLNNAKEILREKGAKVDGHYRDSKYVKMAGHTAYSGVLFALDHYFGKKTKGRKDVDWYRINISKEDRKILDSFETVYEQLHLVMAYDGSGNVEVVKIGFREAERIIDWVEIRTATAA
ncbi:DUF5618 family protein [Dyadobacter jiangsuensis]|uniref:DUF5618 domain-containing protein n=1 Tax=Dyadobacter jiangsuensis TaxID=1591085 RepID=A0A2P8FY99_9BACT|nr:DUF5618 family protein [Dyadobacter jiangsuensis]PSL26699.1 hypothetical protein CLV60_109191 [Dyadobacter jiangsuensis]